MKKQQKYLSIFFINLAALMFLSAPADASTLNGTIGGMAYLTYDQEVWATMKSEWFRSDIHGIPLNDSAMEPTSNTYGNRFFYPQLFVGKDVPSEIPNSITASDRYIARGRSTPEAIAAWRLDDPAQRVPLAQPAGGWAMPVESADSPGLDPGWAAGYAPGSYGPLMADGMEYADPAWPDFVHYISLGGSLRFASDFAAPGGTLWLRGIDIRENTDGKWFIGASGHAETAKYTAFELLNPVFGVNAQGMLTLESDYIWGQSGWSSFFGMDGTTNVLGHLSINPSAVPVPSAVWLFGSALLGLIGLKRRGNAR